MEPDGWRQALRRDVERMAAAADGNLDKPVPTCPAWRVRDLVHHETLVLRFFTELATGRLAEPPPWKQEPLPPDDEVVPRLRQAGAAADAVYEIDPTTPCWSWSPHQHVGFVQRRLAQETVIHLQDALLATTGAEPIERTIAVDGIDEFVDTFLAAQPERLAEAPPIELEAVDVGQRWRIGREDGLPEVSVEATASDLCLLLWRRPTAVSPVIDGDEAVWDAFVEAVKIE